MSSAAQSQSPSAPNPPRSDAAPWKPHHNRWVVALTVTLATFMEILDTSVANVALPHIAGGLSATVDESTWVLTSYLVANAIVLPASAWASTFMGRKRFYMSCVAIFTISSLLCGIAPSLGLLIAFRCMQGAGGGGLAPVEQGILADTFVGGDLGMGFAVYGMAIVLAPIIGPTLGGWITDNFNWRWIFFINIPIGILSLLLSYEVVEDPPYLETERQAAFARGFRVDYVGLALLALTFGPLQVMLDKGEEAGWFQSHFIVIFGVVSLLALIVGVVWELRHDHPIVDLRLFKNRSFAVAAALMFALGVMLYSTTFMLPVFVQMLMGYTAELAGLMISPGGIAILVLMPLVGALSARVDARWLVAVGFIAMAISLYILTGIDLQIDFWHGVMLRVYQCIGLAFLFIPLNTLAYTDSAQEDNNQISGLVNLMRNVGGSVGISLGAAMVIERAQLHQARLVSSVTNYDPGMRSAIRNLARQLTHAGISSADATAHARAQIYVAVQGQAQALAYIDVFYVLAIMSAALPLLLFLARKPAPGALPMH
ncbi:MAG TPA: DHA2 family efflux MFS transporter permease subunit [Candidatus Binataceae bacterium]|nr:DHA2 family efflux MFS transporter permease subunit [Candidatus Binataceae bacterium]